MAHKTEHGNHDVERWVYIYIIYIYSASEDSNGFIATMIIPGPLSRNTCTTKSSVASFVLCGRYGKGGSSVCNHFSKKSNIRKYWGKPYPAIQTMFDGLLPSGMKWYWRAEFLNALTPEIYAQYLKFNSDIPNPLLQRHLYPINEAVSRVGYDYSIGLP